MHLNPTWTYWYIPWAVGLLVQVMVMFQDDTTQAAEMATVEAAAVPTEDITPPSNCHISYSPPYFLGCITDAAGSASCDPVALEEWLAARLKYPLGSKTHKTAGIAEVSFVVGHDGFIRDPKLLRDPGHERGLDLLRAFQDMERRKVRWKPSIRKNSESNISRAQSVRLTHRVKYNMVWGCSGFNGPH
ncbi:energy transducer TonB [Lewinella sp. IMCC34191]|uniref:energy transducer TonB n=1 Tax=Lewinella sp. IMCC34191 TaxID=2259172 RepID=UPI000E27B542|nr:hypothetical protein [Lewinella sp. IMCC34191]